VTKIVENVIPYSLKNIFLCTKLKYFSLHLKPDNLWTLWRFVFFSTTIGQLRNKLSAFSQICCLSRVNYFLMPVWERQKHFRFRCQPSPSSIYIKISMLKASENPPSPGHFLGHCLIFQMERLLSSCWHFRFTTTNMFPLPLYCISCNNNHN